MDILPDPTLYSVCLSVGVLTVEELQTGGLEVFVTTVDNTSGSRGAHAAGFPTSEASENPRSFRFYTLLSAFVHVCLGVMASVF